MSEVKELNGIINVLKPPGMTSFDVVAHLRGLLRIKKIGHTGTLDPQAVGVLPICIGSATKAIEYLMEKDKVYRAELTLGIITDTQDASGNVISIGKVSSSVEEIKKTIYSFIGKYMQLPPMYSAIKINGKKLYELAREGKEVDRIPREVEIFSIDIVRIEETDKVKVLFDVHCSKGTYIRTLCHDIGERLSCGGHMSFLLRKRAGVFDISGTATLEDIKEKSEKNTIKSFVTSTDFIFNDLNEVILDQVQTKRFLNGVPVLLKLGYDINNSELVRVFNNERRFFALGEVYSSDNKIFLRSKKFF